SSSEMSSVTRDNFRRAKVYILIIATKTYNGHREFAPKTTSDRNRQQFGFMIIHRNKESVRSPRKPELDLLEVLVHAWKFTEISLFYTLILLQTITKTMIHYIKLILVPILVLCDFIPTQSQTK